MLSTTGNGNAIQYLEEVKTETVKQFLGGAHRLRQFAPDVILRLCLTENIVDACRGVQQLVHLVALTFVCQSYLILQVVETVVHRCSRKHEHLCLHSLAYNLIEQAQITVLTWVLIVLVGCNLSSVTEIVTFINNHKVVVCPVDMRQILSVGSATSARQVAMEEYIVTQAVTGYGIVQVIALIGNPVVVKFLRTEHQHGLVAVFVVFDDAKGCKRLTQTNAVGKYATVILLQFIYNA